MTVPEFIYVFCLRYSNLMAYIMIWQRNKFTVAGNREYKETDSINDKFRTIVSEVSSFVVNPV